MAVTSKHLSLSETLYGWRAGANRVMLMPDGRCSRPAVVCGDQLVSLKSKGLRRKSWFFGQQINVLRRNFPEEICFRHFRPICCPARVGPHASVPCDPHLTRYEAARAARSGTLFPTT